MRNRNSHRNLIVKENVIDIVTERVVVKVIEIGIVTQKSERNRNSHRHVIVLENIKELVI